MLVGVFALVERSLRLDSRALGPHLARFGLMIAIYIAVVVATVTSSMFGAPGLRFFQSIAYLNLVFMTLMGVGYFSTAITEEKEEDTLGLMLMAGISPLGILLGKSVGRLIQAVILIGVQYPFTLLAVTLGGITQNQIQSTYAGLISYMVLLSGIGLLCSTLAPRNRTAGMWLSIALVAYFVVPGFLYWTVLPLFASSTFLVSALAWVTESCIFIQMGSILTTGFQETLFSYQVVTNVSAGVACFFLSWLTFGLAVRSPSTESATRGLVGRPQQGRRLFVPSRPWFDPFVWKDFHFVSGGVPAVFIRIGIYASIFLVSAAISSGFFGPGLPFFLSRVTTESFLQISLLIVSFDAGLLASRSVHDEIRGQTLSTLLMLPVSTGRILYGKITGSLLCWLIGPVFIMIGILALPRGFQSVHDYFSPFPRGIFFVSFLILMPHLAALTATFVRWGALPLAIALAFGTMFVSIAIFQSTGVSPENSFVTVYAMGIFGLCGACHLAVWLRINSLSAR